MMKYRDLSVAWVIILALAGCNLADRTEAPDAGFTPDAAVAPDTFTEPDSDVGETEADADAQTEADAESDTDEYERDELSVAFVSPWEETSYVNGDIEFELAVTGEPETVNVFANSRFLTSLSAPYTWTWDTSGYDEGLYAVVVIATHGDEFEVSEIVHIVVDRTAPEVVETQPNLPEEIDSVKTPLTIMFSEALDATTVSSDTVKLTTESGESVALEIEYLEEEMSLRLVPRLALDQELSVELSISDGVTDLAGNAFIDWEIGWTYPDFRSAVPSPVEVQYPMVDRKTVILDNTGNPIVLMRICDDFMLDYGYVNCIGAKFLLVYRDVDHWQGITLFDFPTSVFATEVAGDGPDNIYFVWREFMSGQGQNLYVRRWSGTQWEQRSENLNYEPVRSATTFSVSLDSQGHPVVAWLESHSVALRNRVYVRRWDGNDWILLTRADQDSLNSDEGTHASSPQLAVDSLGRPVVAWVENRRLFVARHEDGDWKFLGEARSSGVPFLQNITLNIDGDDKPVVGYTFYESWERDPRPLTLEIYENEDWTSLTQSLMESDLAVNVDSHAVGLDDEGNLLVLWNNRFFDEYYYTAYGHGMFAARRIDSAWQSFDISLVRNPDTHTRDPSVSYHSNGHSMVSWRECLLAVGTSSCVSYDLVTKELNLP
ncbi:MAG: Ig-like domain-containing protein [Bradymonadaceae bacterium]